MVYLFACLVGFLTSSSATRLSRERLPKLMSDNFTCYYPQIERWDHDLCLSRSHYTDTDPTNRKWAAETGSNPRPPDQKSRALKSELPRPLPTVSFKTLPTFYSKKFPRIVCIVFCPEIIWKSIYNIYYIKLAVMFTNISYSGKQTNNHLIGRPKLVLLGRVDPLDLIGWQTFLNLYKGVLCW